MPGEGQLKRLAVAIAAVWALLYTNLPATAAAPLLLHTAGYEAPTRADPDDLLTIAGTGFQPGDRVVYRAMDTQDSRVHAIPTADSASAGIAQIVSQSTPPYAITVRLPRAMQPARAYRLWVVTRQGEWSEPVAINDPRPQWISPAYVYSTAALEGLGRVIRVVGRNLEGVQVRLRGTNTTYTLSSAPEARQSAAAVHDYVVPATLPPRVSPGLYTVSVLRPGLGWIDLPDQKLEVRADPAPLATFKLDDPQFGGCHPDDTLDDSECFARALAAAISAGGGIVFVPPGKWDLTTHPHSDGSTDGFVFPRHIQLRGAGSSVSQIVRHGEPLARRSDALLTLVGNNSVVGIGFSDTAHFDNHEARPVIQLGTWSGTAEVDSRGAHLVKDIVISGNTFLHVGRGITNDIGHPIAELLVTGNEFGAYSEDINLPGNSGNVTEPFRIDDTVIRDNRFVPGSWFDLAHHMGVLATGLGAGHHVDFSANVADGTSSEGLQDPQDPKGWRAGYFWNLNNSVEMTLVSENSASCTGDKGGDGEAIAFDGSGETFAFNGAPAVAAAGTDWVTVNAELIHQQARQPIPAAYYVGHWVKVVDGQGVGQTRRIVSYSEDTNTGTVTLHVAPKWDIPPTRAGGRIAVGRQFWQVYLVGNDIEHRAPPCRKSNLDGPNGGGVVIWSPTADFAIEGNQLHDAEGIYFDQGYSVGAPSCPQCGIRVFFQTNMEIRGNRVEGEYDWSADCSEGGIYSTIGASPTPESPPPIMAFGITISHNFISHSDGPRGGGIDVALAANPGPPPGHWNFMASPLIFHNQIEDMAGPAPSQTGCHRWGQRERSGIHLGADQVVHDAVLYQNSCVRVDEPLVDAGTRTHRLCSEAAADSCECGSSRAAP